MISLRHILLVLALLLALSAHSLALPVSVHFLVASAQSFPAGTYSPTTAQITVSGVSTDLPSLSALLQASPPVVVSTVGVPAAPFIVNVDTTGLVVGENVSVEILYLDSTSTHLTYEGSFVVPVPPASGCASAYPSTVSMYLADAPSPCAYFNATQGFNASSAPLLLTILSVLIVILAVWMGHETIMSWFKRLVTGMTEG